MNTPYPSFFSETGDAAFSRVGIGTRSEDRIPKNCITKTDGDAAFSRVSARTRSEDRIPKNCITKADGDAAFSRVGVGTRSEDRIPVNRIPMGGRIPGEFPFEIVTPTEGYLNAFRQLDATRHNLPHWDQAETFVFLTFRLADSLPKDKLDQWRSERDAWLQDHPEPLDETMRAEYVRLFPACLEKWLDEGSGECLLRNPDARKIVEDALVYFHGTRCDMRCFTVMPNHVHALFRMLPGHRLPDIVHSWKGYSASAINRLLGRKGPVWQKEYFDTCIRDPAHFRRVVRYIWNNAPTLERFRFAAGLLRDREGREIAGDAAFSRVREEGTRPGGRIPEGSRIPKEE